MRHASSPASAITRFAAAGVFLFENHDQALAVWRQLGLRGRALVHVDAHPDLNAVGGGEPVTIANFVSAAAREGIVREIFWVIPDPSWCDGESRRAIARTLRRLARKHGPPAAALDAGNGCLRTRLGGIPVTALTLAALPSFSEPILLDIDTDFLMIPKIRYGGFDEPSALPWCWPEELLSRLEQAGIKPALATIAYSTEGGYTPMAWKYLGEELALRLGNEASGARLAAATELRAGAMAEAAGDWAAAETGYRRAQAEAPGWAAPEYRLAMYLREQGRLPEGRACYARALELDPSYGGLYGSAGMIRLWQRRFDEAEREFERVLQLDASDGYAHYGLAELASERGDFAGAVAAADRALKTAPHLLDAHRVRGQALAALGRIEEAIAAYEVSLRLALEGHKPLEAAILSDPDRAWRLDPMHGRTHAALAHLYARLGRRREAIAGLRMSLGCGYDAAQVRLALAANYARFGAWQKAAVEAGRGLVRLPAELKARLQRRWRIARADRRVRRSPAGTVSS